MSATVEQRSAALIKANVVRSERAKFCRRLKLGASGSWVILHPEWWAETWAIGEVLIALPGIGPSRAGEIMRRVGVTERRPLGALTERQAVALIMALPGVITCHRGGAE